MDEKGVDRLILISVVAIIALVSALAIGFAILPENPNGGDTLLDLPSISDVVRNPFASTAVNSHNTAPNTTHNITHNKTIFLIEDSINESTKDVKNISDDKTDLKNDNNKKTDKNSDKLEDKTKNHDSRDDKKEKDDKDKTDDKDNKIDDKTDDNADDKKDDNADDKKDDKTDDNKDSKGTVKVQQKSWKTVGTYSDSEPSFSLKDDGDQYKIKITAKGMDDEKGKLTIELYNGNSKVKSSKLMVNGDESNEVTIEGSGSGNYQLKLDGDNIETYTVTISEYS
ncbi:hypothetical protein [Methanobrevibacter sp.]